MYLPGMYSLHELATRDDTPRHDHVVHLDGTWEDYLRILKMRGERSAPRIAYLEGVIEIMSPSRDHESIKSRIGRLVEVYCDVYGLTFNAYGSWTLKEKKQDRGVEPDECYVFGTADRDRPHLAIEVVWTTGILDKMEIYRKLRVDEVWVWERGRIEAYVLRGERYRPSRRSKLLPSIDLDLLATFFDREWTSQAIREYRAALGR